MSKSIAHDIFPELSPKEEIFEKVKLVEKSWLDQTTLGFPDTLEILARKFTFFHLKGTQSVFENESEILKPLGISSNFFASLFNLELPIVYIIQCSKGQVGVYLGTNSSGVPGVSALLEANLGYALYEEKKIGRAADFTRPACCTALTGVPDSLGLRVKTNKVLNLQSSGINHLISGLFSEDWTYVVQSFPIKREQIDIWFESCAREVKDITDAFQLSELQKSNRMAANYIEILNQSLKRLTIGKQQGLWQTGIYLLAADNESTLRGAALMSSIYSGDKSKPEPFRCHICSRSSDISPFINVYNTKELTNFVSLPAREFPGFCLKEQVTFDIDFKPQTIKPLSLGNIMDDHRVYNQTCSISVDDLTRHGLVAGTTGSGKTNTLFNILTELNNSYSIPFLVIEPAKSEYRSLWQEIDSLLVFTLGEERPGVSAPFRLNPFEFPAGISLMSHIDFLKAVFNASFVMYAPMPYILEDCLYKIYEDKGWNLITATNPRGRTDASFPTLKDLYWKIDEVVDSIGYQDRTSMDIKAALKTRINNLCIGGKGMMLNSASSLSFEEIMKQPVVLELKYLGNDEEKAFMMGLILMAIWEYYESLQGQNTRETDELKHILVIEEAHRLLKNVPTEKVSEEQSNIKGKGVETFCNLLAEMRAYGEGVLVSEQIPIKLAPDVVKNSNLKIMHRLVAKEDRDFMGDTMNLSRHQKRKAVNLNTGEAILFFEGLDRSVKIQVGCSAIKKNKATISDIQLGKKMLSKFYGHNTDMLAKYPACQKCDYRLDLKCERIKRDVELKSALQGWQENIARFFLPYIIQPDRSGGREYFEAVFDTSVDSYYCTAASVINDYINGRGDYYGWQFQKMQHLKQKTQQNIAGNNFAAEIGRHCQDMAENCKGKYKLCAAYCKYQCFFCYDVSIFARDPFIHQTIHELLNSSSRGLRFYQDLVITVCDYFMDFVPNDQGHYVKELSICFLIQMVNTHRFSNSMQREILENFTKAVKDINYSKPE